MRRRDPGRLDLRGLRERMESEHPRLLVALRPREDVRAAIGQLLPEIPWAFLETSSPSAWTDVDAMLVGSFRREFGRFDATATPHLRFVQRIYTGLDGFPFARFPEPVAIAGNVGAFAPFVAEHALALALAAARDLITAREMVATGRIRPPPAQRPLFGATAVILGYGQIGREIGRRLAGFGAHLIGVNRTGAADPGCDAMYAADRFREALPLGDFVFEVRPLTRATARTIGRTEFERMKPETVFVNVGRAGTIDEEALYQHLVTHPSFRAGIDVWWEEDWSEATLPLRFPFARLSNFVGTPHCAGEAPSADARALSFALENLARFYRDGRPLHIADRREYAD